MTEYIYTVQTKKKLDFFHLRLQMWLLTLKNKGILCLCLDLIRTVA